MDIPALLTAAAERRTKLDEIKANGDLEELVRQMADLRLVCEEIGQAKSAFEECYNFVRHGLIPDLMNARGITKIGVKGIGTCLLVDSLNATAKDKEALIRWLEDHQLEDLISETVNAQTLSAFVRRRMEEAADTKTEPDLPLELLNLRPYTRAEIRK